MGSSGSGNFSDYSGSTAPKDKAGQGGGGTSGVDRCQQAFSTVLEEVAQCDYFVQSQVVPAAGTPLGLVFAKRVFAVDARGVKVGALPTSFNFLATCLRDGVTYAGVVRSSALTPMPTVEVDFVPQ